MANDKLALKQPNYREMRARHLASSLLRELEDYIPRATCSRAYDALLELFVKTDAEIITNMDRTAAGLPERNECGLTPEEHRIMESRKMLALVAPPAPVYLGIDYSSDYIAEVRAKARAEALVEAANHIDGRGFTAVDKLAQELRALAQAARPTPAPSLEGEQS